jgi:gluconate kinase
MLMHADVDVNVKKAKNLFVNDRMNVYASHFEKKSMIETTIKDYETAAKKNYTAQVNDQETE